MFLNEVVFRIPLQGYYGDLVGQYGEGKRKRKLSMLLLSPKKTQTSELMMYSLMVLGILENENYLILMELYGNRVLWIVQR